MVGTSVGDEVSISENPMFSNCLKKIEGLLQCFQIEVFENQKIKI